MKFGGARADPRLLVLLVIVAAAVAIAWWTVLPHLHALISWIGQFRSASRTTGVIFLLGSGYVAICAVATAVCLPLASVFTVLGGFLFGFMGFPLALAGITAGSTPPFLVSRKFGASALAKIPVAVVERFRRGFAQNGAQFLILMRLFPWAPFSATTIIAGALDMPLAKFLLATSLGFVPAGVALTAIGKGAAAAGDIERISMASLLRQPEFLLLLAGIGGLVVLDLVRRRVQGQRFSD